MSFATDGVQRCSYTWAYPGLCPCKIHWCPGKVMWKARVVISMCNCFHVDVK